ncbi:MAG TPA: hypothetical protein VJM31_04785 [Vicinamibacterales bacterium]|nr:hypothetical protein [Vicinamibacterales bacterium]
MRKVTWLAAGSVLSAAVLAARFGREVWLGMLAPLVVTSATWILTERVYRASPERLSSVMISAFAAKLVFFGVYVGLAVGVFGIAPVPFVVSFTGYFIALHMIEALWLKRLFVS